MLSVHPSKPFVGQLISIAQEKERIKHLFERLSRVHKQNKIAYMRLFTHLHMGHRVALIIYLVLYSQYV